MNQELISRLAIRTDSTIVLLLVDGLGGLPHPGTGLTELETAVTPNLDALAAEGALGLSTPIAPGITPGSGCLLYTSPSPRDRTRSRMPSSA